jgi:oligopeptide/dipeptide ABC transporter ATP-binding protein
MTPSPNLLEMRDLTVTYRRGHGHPELTALSAVSLGVAPGETLGIVGESGSGKSTLGNAILGVVTPAAGTIRFAGQDITAASPAQRRRLTRDIQAVFQNPQGSLNPVRTIGQTLEEPLLAHRHTKRDERRAEVGAALERVGLDRAAATRFPAHFSGGQLQRIAIARALMLPPRLLVCDEAVSALDLSIQAQILNLLRTLQRELALSYLFISHDLAVIRHVSDRVAVLYRGRLMETGTVAQVCERPAHPYTRALLAAAPLPDPAMQRARHAGEVLAMEPATSPLADAGCPFRHRCPFAVDACADPLPAYGGSSHMVACHRFHELATERGASQSAQPAATANASSTDAGHDAELIRGARSRGTA